MDKKIKKILIIGGNGFIGSNLIKKLSKLNFKITNLSKNKKNNININKVDYIQANIANFNDLNKKLERKNFDYIINLAGYGDHSSFLDGGIKVIEDHYISNLNLSKIFLKKKISKFIQIGSSDEYGFNVAPQKENVKEDPISPYSFAKTSSTYLFRMLYNTYSFPVVILRLFLVYGPYQKTNRLIPYVIKSCIENKKFNISHGLQYRDFCYIDDVTDAIIKVIHSKKVYGEILNIATGKKIQVKYVVNFINNFIKKGHPQFNKFKKNKKENINLFANVQKVKNLLKWESKTKITEGLKKTIKYYYK